MNTNKPLNNMASIFVSTDDSNDFIRYQRKIRRKRNAVRLYQLIQERQEQAVDFIS